MEVEGETEYEVDEILDSRLHYRKLQYLVKWTGYDVPTWNPVEFVAHLTDMLAVFHCHYPHKLS